MGPVNTIHNGKPMPVVSNHRGLKGLGNHGCMMKVIPINPNVPVIVMPKSKAHKLPVVQRINNGNAMICLSMVNGFTTKW